MSSLLCYSQVISYTNYMMTTSGQIISVFIFFYIKNCKEIINSLCIHIKHFQELYAHKVAT